MYIGSPKEADISDYARRISNSITTQEADVVKQSQITLANLLIRLSGELDLNVPLAKTLSEYETPGFRWDEILEHLLDVHKEPKPTNLKRFLRDYRRHKAGAIIIPDSDPSSYYILQGYLPHGTKIKYSIGQIEIINTGDYPYPSLGKSSDDFHVTYKSNIKGRLFRSDKLFDFDIDGERKRFRSKLVKILTIFTSKVLEGVLS